jgi:AcrR family transcriptional regulator
VSTRRERLKAETADEIKAIALQLMADGGPDAISLRAIARQIGMTPAALYGYFPTRDELVTALIRDVYTSLVDNAEAARDARPADDSAGRILAWAQAFRQWAVTGPAGFRLIYGDPINGYRPPPGGPAAEAERRACAGLVGLVAAAWPTARSRQPPTDHQWEDFDPHLAADIRATFPDLPPSAAALALRLWGRMHGLVSLEVYGHLPTQSHAPEKLYQAEMLDLIASLGLTGAPS